MGKAGHRKDDGAIRAPAEWPACAAACKPDVVDAASRPRFTLGEIMKRYDPRQSDGVAIGREILQWMVAPVSAEDFLAQHYQQRPLLVRRQAPDYWENCFTSWDMHEILCCAEMKYGTDLDVTDYTDQGRITLNPQGNPPAPAQEVWGHFALGRSVRFLRPQEHCDRVWVMMALLEEYFGTNTGCNAYLTPEGSQGFAPHYDDVMHDIMLEFAGAITVCKVEAFLLQVEGRKRWRVYAPRAPEEWLARESSPNFDQSDVGEPVLDAWLEQGDLLYIPRGCIHQAHSDEDTHSLHITVSTAQGSHWADLVEHAAVQAVQLASRATVALRASLPPHFFRTAINNRHADTQYGHGAHNARDHIVRYTKNLLNDAVGKHFAFDQAASFVARTFLHRRLPPPSAAAVALARSEPPARSGRPWDSLVASEEDTDHSNAQSVEAAPVVPSYSAFADVDDLAELADISSSDRVRLAASAAAWIHRHAQTDEIGVYFSTENARSPLAQEEQWLACTEEFVPVIEVIIQAYPKYLSVSAIAAAVGADEDLVKDVRPSECNRYTQQRGTLKLVQKSP